MQINNQKNVEHEQAKASKRKIGPVKKGALHSELHIPQGQKIGRSRLESEKAIAKKEGNTTLEKRVDFALNMGGK